VTSAEADRFVIEPLDPERHDRAGFSCGVAQVDNFFHRTANKLARAGNVRVFVMRSPDGDLVGFYAINAHGVDYRDLPPRFARTRPGHGTIPAAYLSMMGVDRRFAGQGHGGELLVDALLRIHRLSREIGTAVVMLDVLDCGDPGKVAMRQALYAKFGFAPLASDPKRMFLPVATVDRLLGDHPGDHPGD